MINKLVLNYSEHMTDLDIVLNIEINDNIVTYSLFKMFEESIENIILDKEDSLKVIKILNNLNLSTWKDRYEPLFCSINSYEWSLIINDKNKYSGYNAQPKEFKLLKDLIKELEG